MEVAARLEPAKTGFADRRLDRFGKHAREAQDGETGGGEVVDSTQGACGGTGRRIGAQGRATSVLLLSSDLG